MDGSHDRLHATAVAVGQRAVIIRGPSGSGKSDLALRCLALAPSQLIAEPARLVADDQVLVRRAGTALLVSAPPTLLGRLEVRGLGIFELAPAHGAQAVLLADLVAEGAGRTGIERYPDPWPSAEVLGLRVPVMRVCAFDASAAIKVLAALALPGLPAVG